MTLRQSEDGRWYGTCTVLLTRVVDGETQEIVGTRPPFGGITVRDFEGARFLEEWDEFWKARGFTITEPPILEEARRISRAAHVRSSAPESEES